MLSKLITKLKYWNFRRIHSYPHFIELTDLGFFGLLSKELRRTSKSHFGLPKKYEYTLDYIYGQSLEEIGKKHNVTIERVRRSIINVYNMLKRS